MIDTNNIDGIIATNTTIDYPDLKSKNKKVVQKRKTDIKTNLDDLSGNLAILFS